jgi:2-oxoisovalerate dehydrogenase E1 component
VHAKHQTTKENLSSILSGFQTDKDGLGYEIIKVKGWDYPNLIKAYQKATSICRKNHTPVIVHVVEVTQPQGHSTSGSHERYKSAERLNWEAENDCIKRMREWIESQGIATSDDLVILEKEALDDVKAQKQEAWQSFTQAIKQDLAESVALITDLASASNIADLATIAPALQQTIDPMRRDIGQAVNKALRLSIGTNNQQRMALVNWYKQFKTTNEKRYDSHQYSQSANNALNVPVVAAEFSSDSEVLNGFEVLQRFFDMALTRDPRVLAFGEDMGKIGDVNQGFAGLQDKHGEMRVSDMGIRELTIIGQALGASIRGLRPIAEIQYLDYLLYAIQIMSDDIATLQYRTHGGQKAPLIIRTRGHRLEGIWHSGSPMGMIINAVRGIHVLVPRNMVQAAGFYNTLLQSDEPGLVVECLNGYRLKETLPDNIADYTVALGVPETLIEGTDITLVTYGSCTRIAEAAIEQLNACGVSVELIDAQSLLPFDRHHLIVDSLKKTNKLVCLDEDVPGGASAYMLQQILEIQEGYKYLDAAPLTISAKEHRPAYGTDGDYFSKPSAEDVFQQLYQMMHNYEPNKYPELF